MDPTQILLALHPDGRLHSVHDRLEAAAQSAHDIGGCAVVLSAYVEQARAADAVCRSMHAAGYIPPDDFGRQNDAAARTIAAFTAWHAHSGLPGEGAPAPVR